MNMLHRIKNKLISMVLYMLIKMIADMEAIKDVERKHFIGIKNKKD